MQRRDRKARRASVAALAAAFWAGLAAEAAAQGDAAADRAALVALYDAAGGPTWTDSTNWKTDAPLGEWFGVTTDAGGRVTGLSLWGNGLSGAIPPTLGDLSSLEWLSLDNNELDGPIPSALGKLSSLTGLYLSWNDLTGPVPPWLGNLVGLRWLDLSSNALTGPIPDGLRRLVNLESLFLGGNDLTGGPVPPWLGNLTGLRRLDLSSSALTGPIPDGLGGLLNLEALYLGWNDLTGPVPPWLGNLTELRWMDLSWNGLAGPIPEALGGLANLEWLNLSSNALTGPIPDELAGLADLESLYLSWNPLTGTLPRGLTQLPRLARLAIDGTAACAPADDEFQAWLATIDDFRGATCNRAPQPVDAIPAQALAESGPTVGVSVEPYFSDPDDDALTYAAASSDPGRVAPLVSGGVVWLVPGTAGTATVTVTASDPGGLSATQAVAVTTEASAGPQDDREVLELLYDSTGGAGWTESANWKTAAPLGEWHGVTTDADGRVTALALSRNGLAGPIPEALAGLTNLEGLSLFGNELTGPVPAWLGDLVHLRSLYLSWNDLTGRIPDELGRLENLVGLGLSGSGLTGPVPAWLGDLAELRWLYLSWNDLTGPIPARLRNLENLETLYLDGNDLTGQIPAWLESLGGLRALSLAGTALTGGIPGELGSLPSLERLDLSYAWGLSGPLPPGLRSAASLGELDIFATRTCAPAAWRDWLEAMDEFDGRLCGSATDFTVDVAVFYTPAAREEAGGTAEIEAVIDLMIAETNEAYAASGVHGRLALVARSRSGTSRRATSRIYTVSRIRRTATWTRSTPCATGPGPTSCIWSSNIRTIRSGEWPTARVPSPSPASTAAAGFSRTSWATTWACATTGTRCTTTKAAFRPIRRTAT